MEGMNMKIRNATIDDIIEIIKVNRSCLITEGGNGLIQARSREEFDRVLQLSKYFFVAESDNKVIGYLTVLDESTDFLDNEIFSFYPKHYKNFVFVDQIAVHPDYRHSGVAKKLYEKLVSAEKNSDNKRIILDVLVKPVNYTSINFHKAIGFKSLGDIIHLKN